MGEHNQYTYLTPDEIELLEMYRKATPEMKAAMEKCIWDVILQDEDDCDFKYLNL